MKGKAEPVPAFEVAGFRAEAGNLRGLPGVTTPLFGRDAELRTAQDFGEAVLAGRGGILFVIGEPGVGKTRLLSEFPDLVCAEVPVTWLEGRCVWGKEIRSWPRSGAGGSDCSSLSTGERWI